MKMFFKCIGLIFAWSFAVLLLIFWCLAHWGTERYFVLAGQIMVQQNNEFWVSFCRSSGLSFWPDTSDTATMPLQFGEFLGSLEYYQARIVVLILGYVFWFSMSATSSQCLFCPNDLHTVNLFTCPNCRFRNMLWSWNSFMIALHVSQWALSISLVLKATWWAPRLARLTWVWIPHVLLLTRRRMLCRGDFWPPPPPWLRATGSNQMMFVQELNYWNGVIFCRSGVSRYQAKWGS